MLCGYPPFYAEKEEEIKKLVLDGNVEFGGNKSSFNLKIQNFGRTFQMKLKT